MKISSDERVHLIICYYNSTQDVDLELDWHYVVFFFSLPGFVSTTSMSAGVTTGNLKQK